MANASQITNHVQQALGRLLQQYKNSENLKGLLTAFVQEIQNIENMNFDLLTNRTLDNATGTTLDNIGSIVGVARQVGESDANYRTRIREGIFKNRAQGTAEILIEVVQLFTEATVIVYSEGAEASFAFWINDQSMTQDEIDALYEGLRASKAAGVKIEGVTAFDGGDAFAMDGTALEKGFGSVTDPLAGGKFATLLTES